MKLILSKQQIELKENGLPKNRGKDHFPVVKLFIPSTNCVWLLTELVEGNSNMAFGLCDLGTGKPELRYVDLNEISHLTDQLCLSVERDTYFTALYPISVYARAAYDNGQITEIESILYHYALQV